ncbi:MAG: TonB-dependent receptor plug domain-containing protein, partial [Candidatus Methanomethylophilaceae archaeon]|nr:TonB-dependent receptor plug domain-containing protein [Candidatus Methanomethylophilaceae archaeon]
MRQSILRILILALMLSAALGSFAQTPSTYIAEMKKLKDEYNVTFVYDSSLLLDASSRSVGSRQSLTRSLRDLFEGSGFRYELRGHTVIVLREGDRSPVDYEQPSAIFDTLRPSVIEGALHDTLRAARVEADRFVRRDAGTRIVALPEIRTMVSVTGEADAIKYVQTLPGVSTGAEGSSAIYVRGGNIGSNLTTIDGVALYGGSHLLGMTSAYPTDIVSSISFRMGGFHGDESNITASHIGLWTKDGNFTKKEYSVS